MSRLRFIKEYYDRVRHQVATSGCTDDWAEVRFKKQNGDETRGYVRAEAIRFSDDAILRFNEEVTIHSDGTVDRLSYSFRYDRPRGETCTRSESERSRGYVCYFFRYDRDPKQAKPVVHEECHLHVNDLRSTQGEELRFKTHATSFEEVFEFIRCLYYS